MSVQVITGDCRQVLAGLEAESVDCVVSDPPYGETNLRWDKWPAGWPSLVLPLLKPTGSMWVFGSMRMFLERIGEFSGWRMAQEIVWEKHNGSSFHSDRFRRVHEFAVQFYRADTKWSDVHKKPQFSADATARTVRRNKRPQHWHGEIGPTEYRSEDGGPRLIRSVVFCRSEHGRALHPTQKPLDLLDLLLAYSCPPGGAVLDPFAGSGSTGVAARARGLSTTLIEADPAYAAGIEERLVAELPLVQQGATA